MSFFSESDRASRQQRLNQQQFPSAEERRRYSHNWAQQKLPEVLSSIKESFRNGSRGVSFSYDRSPFAGSTSSLDPRLDYEMGVAELVRLVRQAGVQCTPNSDNNYTRSGFGVEF